MKLTQENIANIGTLARLHLSEEDKQKYAEQLSVVLDYVSMLNEVDTDGVEETCQVTGLEDMLRDDVVNECSPERIEKIIGQFPDKSGDLLRVKAVFTDED